jgi:hypothetical protein
VSIVRQRIKRILPRPLWIAGREIWLGGKHLAAWPLATLHPWRRASLERLGALKDSHKGERAFILGNGPSLKHTDVSKLRGEQTFGMNRVFLAFEEWGFATSYLVSVNDLVNEQSAEEIERLQLPKFLSWRARHFIEPDEHTSYLFSTYERPTFAKDVRGRVWEGATVTYVALQLAYHMGFETVVLIGVDHSFKAQGTPNTTVVSQGADVDHFDARYFGKGLRWQLPDLEVSEQAYRMAKQAFEADGRRVLDATIGGQLDVFDKVAYEDLF